MFKYLVAVCILAGIASAQLKATVTLSGVITGVTGQVNFTETSDGILIQGSVSGLSQGNHGFHVHALGDLSNGCASTGAHFNPHNATHGAPNDTVRHVGDLGNIIADSTGVAQINFTDNVISLSGEHNILGRAVVVHQDEDDLGKGGKDDSLTTGHAGARVACGIIGTLNPTNGASYQTVSYSILVTLLIFLIKSLTNCS